MTKSQIDALACEFAITLRGHFGAGTWEAMRAENARHADERRTGVCASHDYCDANEVMAEAFATIVGRELDVQSADDCHTINEAWDRARVAFLTMGA